MASFASSYIKTEGTTVTRAADVADISGSNFSSWYRQDEGTVFADIQANGQGRIFMFDDGVPSNRWDSQNVSGFLTARSWTLGTQDGQISTNPDAFLGTSNWSAKLAISAALNNLTISANGTSSKTDTSVTFGNSVNTLRVGSYLGTASYLNGTFKRLTYWSQKLPEFTLQTITQ